MLLWQKTRNAKNLKFKFQQRVAKLKCLIDKRAILTQFFATIFNKILLMEYNFEISAITFQNKIALIKLFLITLLDLTIIETKMALLSFLINHHHQTRYISQ